MRICYLPLVTFLEVLKTVPRPISTHAGRTFTGLSNEVMRSSAIPPQRALAMHSCSPWKVSGHEYFQATWAYKRSNGRKLRLIPILQKRLTEIPLVDFTTESFIA